MAYTLPAKLSGYNVCSSASKVVLQLVLILLDAASLIWFKSLALKKHKNSLPIKKALWQLAKEIGNAIKLSAKKNMIPCFRLNLTSDLPWEALKLNQTIKTFAYGNVS